MKTSQWISFLIAFFCFIYLPLFAQQSQKYTEDDYHKDLQTLAPLDQKFNYYYSQGKEDSIYFMYHKYMPVAERAYAFKQDTMAAVEYYFAKIRYGVSMAHHLGKMEDGLQMAEEAYEEAWNDPKVNWHFNMATTANILAKLCRIMGDIERGFWYLHRSLEIKREIYPDNHPMIGNQYLNLAFFHNIFGEYAREEYHLRKAIDIYEKYPGRSAKFVYGRIANSLFRQNRKKEAFELLQRELRTFNIQSGFDLAEYCYLLSNLGQLYTEEGNYSKAKDSFWEIITKLQHASPDFFTTNFHTDPNGEKPFYTFRSSHLPRLSETYQYLGDIANSQKKYTESIEYFEKSIELEAKYRGDQSAYLPQIKIKIASAYAKLGVFEKAEKEWLDGFSQLAPNLNKTSFDAPISIEELWPTVQIIEALYGKASIADLRYKEEGYSEIALSTYLLIDDLIGRMTNYLSHETTNIFILKNRVNQYYEKGISFLLRLYEERKDEQFLSRAFQFVESSKATSLMTALLSSKAQKFYQLPSELLEKEKATNIYLSHTEKLLFEEENKKEKADQERLNVLTAHVNVLKMRRDSILNILQKDHNEYFRFKYQKEIPDIYQFQAFLGKIDREVLEYFWGENLLFTFFIGKNGVTYKVDSIDRQSMEEEIIQFINLLKKPDFDEIGKDYLTFSKSGFELYKKLNLGLLKNSQTKNILIIPDGILHTIPFHLLSTKEEISNQGRFDNHPYLFRKYTTSVEYSAFLHLLSSGQKNKFDRTYLGFAPLYRAGSTVRSLNEEDEVAFNGRFPIIAREGVYPLRFNRLEVEECADIFKGQAYIDKKALEIQFKKEGKGAQILHLAMHAFLDDSNPLYSRFAFNLDGKEEGGEDGLLYAYELYNTRLNADLAILSACNTGAGRVTKGEGVISLSHAFKYAGCPNVVLNYWLANDKSSKDLVVSFARHLKDGKGKAEALNEARKEYLENAPESAMHPYFWGGLTLIGDDEPVQSAGGNKLWLIGLAMLVSFLLIARFKKK